MENMEKKVFEYFEEMSRIPRGSGNTGRITEYIVKFAEDHGLWYRTDEHDNIIIKKPAAKGYENADPVILQGHTDMVCEKTADCSKDMATEGLTLKTDGDWMYAEGTTLGADDGIAVAMALAVLDSKELGHPALECIFTSDEEIGMIGARHLDMSDITARKMINVDSEEEGIFTVSCAGGTNAVVSIPAEYEANGGKAVLGICIEGLTGGHSGIMIIKERANSNELMGRLLAELSKKHDIRVGSISGGKAGNVICKMTEAAVGVDAGEVAQIKEEIAAFEETLRHEFRATDPDMKIAVSENAGSDMKLMDADSSARVITYLMTAPNGIQDMSAEAAGEVETSLNIGAVNTDGSGMKCVYAVRSSSASRKEMLKARLERLAGVLGGSVVFEGDYPGWEYLKDSALRETAIGVFKEQYGHDPEVLGIHAGLECGLIAEKIGEGFDAISIGPDLMDVHTPDEKMSIASAKRTFRLVCGILEACK